MKRTPILVAVGALAGCLSTPGPGVAPDQFSAFQAQWSGEWTLDADTSDDPAQVLAALQASARSDRGGASGRGGGGGRTGGRRASGGGGTRGQNAPGNALPLSQITTVVGTAPSTLSLEMGQFLWSVSEVPGTSYHLPISGDTVQPYGDEGLEVKIRWNEARPTIERRWEGWSVDDSYELVTPDRLLVTREVSTGSASAMIRLVFDRVTEP